MIATWVCYFATKKSSSHHSSRSTPAKFILPLCDERKLASLITFCSSNQRCSCTLKCRNNVNLHDLFTPTQRWGKSVHWLMMLAKTAPLLFLATHPHRREKIHYYSSLPQFEIPNWSKLFRSSFQPWLISPWAILYAYLLVPIAFSRRHRKTTIPPPPNHSKVNIISQSKTYLVYHPIVCYDTIADIPPPAVPKRNTNNKCFIKK